jgi:hypothetical protein
MKTIVCFLATIIIALQIYASPSFAALYHVSQNGTKVTGSCQPNNWDFENCYSNLDTVAPIATHSDTILLDYGEHDYQTSNSFPALLANRNLDLNYKNFKVIIWSLSQFHVSENQNNIEVRGIAFSARNVQSDLPLFNLNKPGNNFDQIFLNNCQFFNINSSALGSEINIGGGVLRALSTEQPKLIKISNCEFQNNFSAGDGGSIGVLDGWNVLIDNSSFIGNYSNSGYGNSGMGGAIAINSPNKVTYLSLYNCVIESNYSTGPGGAISVNDGTLELFSTDLLNNQSGVEHHNGWKAGAGIFMRANENSHNSERFLRIDDCEISGNFSYPSENTGAGDGGGVFVKGITGHMTEVIVNNTIFENNFNMQGGGLYIGRYTNGVVDKCIFKNNKAHFSGGGSFKGGAFYDCLGETAAYSYCVFVGNEAGVDRDGSVLPTFGWGGAFCTRLFPRATFTNCTFLNNGVYGDNTKGDAFYSHHEGTHYNDPNMRSEFSNCLFWGTAGSDIQINVPDNAIALFSDCAIGIGEFICEGVAPLNLIELDFNPCASLTDFSLPDNSQCIDMASPTQNTTDFFGNPVPSGQYPDIGAIEFMQASSIHYNTPTNTLNILPAFPNPFNPSTTLSFSLENQSLVSIDIADIYGRLINSKRFGVLSSGQHSYRWSGINNEGNSLPSGQYFAIFSAGSEQIVQKLILLK